MKNIAAGIFISSMLLANSNCIAQESTESKRNTSDSIEVSNFCNENAFFTTDNDVTTMTTLNYFGTSISISIYGAEESTVKPALCSTLSTIERLHKSGSDYSTYDNVVNVKTINNAPTETHKIDPELMEIIQAGIEWHRLSDGYFNIAIGPVVQVWRRYRKACDEQKQIENSCQIPTLPELKEANKFTDINKIILDEAAVTITMAEGMSIDLGGIAKGWMTERVHEHLLAAGMKSFVINAGGNIRHYGVHPEGRKFNTAIEDPICKKYQYRSVKCEQIDHQFHEVVAGENLTVVSSGNYLKYYSVDDVDYHHIIDPKTLFPKPTGVSTSVILNANHIYADVLSTTLFLMPVENAFKMAEGLKYVEAVWYLDQDGHKKSTGGFDQYRIDLFNSDFVTE